jgi:hypothetical protein
MVGKVLAGAALDASAAPAVVTVAAGSAAPAKNTASDESAAKQRTNVTTSRFMASLHRSATTDARFTARPATPSNTNAREHTSDLHNDDDGVDD